MSRRLVALLGATCLLLLGLGSAIAMGHGDGDHPKSHHQKGNHHPGGKKKGNVALFAELNGRNEISTATGQRGAGDPDGFGSASFTFDGDRLCFGITVANLDTPVAAHIHKGAKNANGDIVIGLTQPMSGDPGASSGCVALDRPELVTAAAEIQANPRGFYANVHTTAFMSGAVRGQLKSLRHSRHHH
jgi:CHRD domain-containing protein